VAPATRGSPAVHETKPVHQSSASRSPLTFSSGPPPAGHGRQRHLEAPYYTLYEITMVSNIIGEITVIRRL
jgi:hypothetical protein